MTSANPVSLIHVIGHDHIGYTLSRYAVPYTLISPGISLEGQKARQGGCGCYQFSPVHCLNIYKNARPPTISVISGAVLNPEAKGRRSSG